MAFVCGQFCKRMYFMTNNICLLVYREGSQHGLDGHESVYVTGGPSSRLPFPVSC